MCLFNISHVSSTVCSETMAKRLQQDSGEERVKAKSRPMMSLIARVPSNVSFSASESLGKRSYGNHNPWSANAGTTRCGQRPKNRAWLLSRTIYWALSQHATQSGMITKHGLLKSGKLISRWTIERGDRCERTAHGPIHYWKRWDEFLHRSRISFVVRIKIILG